MQNKNQCIRKCCFSFSFVAIFIQVYSGIVLASESKEVASGGGASESGNVKNL